MSPTPEQVRILAAQCEQFRDSKAPGGYRDSLALCIIDSVQSTGVKYKSVENVIVKYRQYRKDGGSSAETDGANDLASTFDALGGSSGWADRIGNGNRTSTKAGAPLKALAIDAAARVLINQGIDTAEDLRRVARDPQRLSTASTEWCRVPGQKSGVTWHYVQMLAGVQGVKPDRMIIRFVANALGLSVNKVSTAFASEAIVAVAKAMGIPPTDLDHGIWQWQRRR